jgi:hypothetical protein
MQNDIWVRKMLPMVKGIVAKVQRKRKKIIAEKDTASWE